MDENPARSANFRRNPQALGAICGKELVDRLSTAVENPEQLRDRRPGGTSSTQDGACAPGEAPRALVARRRATASAVDGGAGGPRRPAPRRPGAVSATRPRRGSSAARGSASRPAVGSPRRPRLSATGCLGCRSAAQLRGGASATGAARRSARLRRPVPRRPRPPLRPAPPPLRPARLASVPPAASPAAVSRRLRPAAAAGGSRGSRRGGRLGDLRLLGRQLAALGHDEDPQLGGHVGEDLDRDRVAADALDRLHVELAAVDADLLLRPTGGRRRSSRSPSRRASRSGPR